MSRCRRAARALLFAVGAAGCKGPAATHAVALQAATAPVVDQAEAAYRAAVELHDVRVDFDAAAQFDKAEPVYNPRTIKPLLSTRDIDVRLAVLTGFQLYVKSLAALAGGTDTTALDAASTSVGTGLTTLGNTVGPVFASALGLAPAAGSAFASETSTGTAIDTTPISPAARNGVSTALEALGLYLERKQINRDLPEIVGKMDGTVESLCQLLEKDLDILTNQETLDYNFIIDQQTLFLRLHTPNQTDALGSLDRREQIMKLPGVVRQWRSTDAELRQLKAAIVKLSITHHALAAELQGNSPASLKEKLAELEAAGSALGRFYSSLPTT